jgi:biopolymer transport protein ExbD
MAGATADMNFRGKIPPSQQGLPIAPMVDVVFLLLIFFLVTWNFSRGEMELDVNVPKAREGKESRRSVGEVILNVTSDGAIIMNRRTLDADGLLEALARISELYPDQAVILRGDEAADYRHIVEVLDICRRASIWNVAFATSKPE